MHVYIISNCNQKLELVYLCISPNGLQPGHCDDPPPILHDRKSLSIAFLAIFRSIRNFFFHKMAASGHFASILDNQKSLLIAFLTIFDQYATFFFTFWMTKNHFWSHFSPFQINTQFLFFSTKWLPATILDDQKSHSPHRGSLRSWFTSA